MIFYHSCKFTNVTAENTTLLTSLKTKYIIASNVLVLCILIIIFTIGSNDTFFHNKYFSSDYSYDKIMINNSKVFLTRFPSSSAPINVTQIATGNQ